MIIIAHMVGSGVSPRRRAQLVGLTRLVTNLMNEARLSHLPFWGPSEAVN